MRSKNTNLNMRNRKICAAPITPYITYDFLSRFYRYSIRFNTRNPK